MYIVSYPNSGSTWLSFLLCYCLNSEYEHLDSKFRKVATKPISTKKLTHPSYQPYLGKVLETHQLEIRNRDNSPLIYVVRDGRNVIASAYNEEERLMDFFKKITKLNFLRTVPFLPDRGKLSRYLRDSNFSQFASKRALDWERHVKQWIERKPLAILRYEDLRVMPRDTIQSLLMRLDVEVSPDVIQRAITELPVGEFFPSEQNVFTDWEKRLPPQAKDNFMKKTQETLALLGYTA